MPKAGIGEVVKMDPEPMPIGKLPGELDSRAEFDRIAEIFPFAGGKIAGGKARSEQEMIPKEEIKIDSEIAVEGASSCRH